MKALVPAGLLMLMAILGPACKPAHQAGPGSPQKLFLKDRLTRGLETPAPISRTIFTSSPESSWQMRLAESKNADHRSETIRRWSEEDAPAAADWALRLPMGPDRNTALEQVALGWASRDLPGAFSWASRLPADAPVSFLLATLAIEVSRTDPVAALDVAAQLPAGPVRDELFRHAISEWSVADPLAADRWARTVQEEPLRSALLRAVAAVVATREAALPIAAARFQE